jgi:predicted enzyme related to lactoylglutathione lyase
MADAGSRGRFVWHDLMTTDPKKAQDFYTNVIGWGTQPFNDAGMAYTMWTANGTPLGGVMDGPPHIPPHWLAYVSVPDTDAAVKQVESLGGRIVKPAADIPNVGRFAIAVDPEGAAFSLFTPANGLNQPETKPAIGEFSWHELMADDYKKAWSFYRDIFGWEQIEEHDMGPMGIYFIYGRKGQQLGGMFSKPPEMQMPASWMHYVRVDSADRVADLVKANGGTVMNGPMEVPGGDRIIVISDPGGVNVGVVGPGK